MIDSRIIKRGGEIEAYDPQKLYRSLIAACLSIRTPEGSAETAAKHVVGKTEAWLKNKPEVTSADIRRKAAEALLAYNPDAAYIYKQHRSIS
jgi:transcriptional regulator NrdR family protein